VDRKKELKEQYKQRKTDMGIMIIRSNFDRKCFLEATQDLQSRLNRARFSLDYGGFFNKELQKVWKEHGAEAFTIEVLEKLPYDKEDEAKTDYSEDLQLMQMIWEDKLTVEGWAFYK